MKINTTAHIDSPARGAAAYWFVDGLAEIAFGLALLIFGLFGVWGIARGKLHWQNWWMWVGLIVAELLFLVMFIMHRRILDSLKARITYPRTGYVRPPADFPSKSNPPDKILTLGTVHQVDENVSSFRSHTVLWFNFRVYRRGFPRGALEPAVGDDRHRGRRILMESG